VPVSVDVGKFRDGRHGFIFTVHDVTGFAFVDDFRNRSAAPSDHGGSACHGLDHDQAERLRPVDRKQQGTGVAQERRLLAVADLADELDERMVEQRLYDFMEIGPVRISLARSGADSGIEVTVAKLKQCGRLSAVGESSPSSLTGECSLAYKRPSGEPVAAEASPASAGPNQRSGVQGSGVQGSSVLKAIRHLAAARGELHHDLLVQPNVHFRRAVESSSVAELLRQLLSAIETAVQVQQLHQVNDGFFPVVLFMLLAGGFRDYGFDFGARHWLLACQCM
jgi:hypothetical protein